MQAVQPSNRQNATRHRKTLISGFSLTRSYHISSSKATPYSAILAGCCYYAPIPMPRPPQIPWRCNSYLRNVSLKHSLAYEWLATQKLEQNSNHEIRGLCSPSANGAYPTLVTFSRKRLVISVVAEMINEAVPVIMFRQYICRHPELLFLSME